MEIPDQVRKQIEIGAPIERVWDALTTPAGLLTWFPTHHAGIDLRPGGTLSLAWADDADEGLVDVVDPPYRFGFRWRPAGTERPYTTVEFTLEDLRGRTRLTLVESGFATLPERTRERSWHANDRGWTEELEELRSALEAA